MKRLVAGITLLLLAAFIPSNAAHADVNDFTITNFDSNMTLSRSDPQGELHAIETITVNFTDQNHGIKRAVPKKYGSANLKFHLNSVSSSSGAPAQASVSAENGNIVLKIGDPSRTVTGVQSYTIDYTLQNVIRFYDDHDEIYLDVTGDQWDQPINQVSYSLALPDGLHVQDGKLVCYSGAYESTDQNCTVSQTDTAINASTTTYLLPRQNLTVIAGFDKGYFTPPTFMDRLRDNMATIAGLTVPPLVGLLAGFTWWRKKGRDEPGKGTIVPEYEPPQGLNPLLAGTVADFKVDNRDFTATIIDLAQRGYIKINAETKKQLFGSNESFTLELTKNDFAKLDSFELQLMQALFPLGNIGNTLDTGLPNAKLASATSKIRKKVTRQLATNGYFKSDPAKYQGMLAAVFVVIWIGISMVALFVTLHILWAFLGSVVGLVIFGIFMSRMPARTQKGTEVREQLLGLKLFMETTQKDRIKMLDSPSAPYIKKEPKRTVKLFEKLLPYAIIMGVEKEWAEQFKDMYKAQPEWYSGNINTFSAVYLASSLHSGLATSVSSSFSAPHASSSSSGFSSGGGFSGGGAGGGGGGGW